MNRLNVLKLATYLTTVGFWIPFATHAADFAIPHAFKSGEIISAEIFNEINSEIQQSRKLWTSADIVGQWSCTSVASADSSAVSGWQADADSLYQVLESATMTFAADGDNTFSFTTSAPNPFDASDANAMTATSYAVAHSFFWFKTFSTTPGGATTSYVNRYSIAPVGSTRFTLKKESQSFGTSPVTLTCDKKATVPENPTQLSISATGASVTLTWKDNSTNETGFKIFRRDTLAGEYKEIGTTVVDITVYTDTAPSSGTFWYRVKSTNQTGDSLGSNIVRFRYEP